MNCYDKKCKYKELNGGDEISDFYFCKYVGITVDRGNEECLIERFEREIYQEAIEKFKKLKENSNQKLIELYELAIDANGQYNKLVTYCYSCGETVKNMKHCCNCGQRLDWSNN